MQFIKPAVSTMCVGQAASMGALLLAGGARGKRVCLPHSRIMIHQPLGGFQGQATDIDIHAREILLIREKLNMILAKHTGQSLEKIRLDTERDNFMGANEAREYGLIVITSYSIHYTKLYEGRCVCPWISCCTPWSVMKRATVSGLTSLMDSGFSLALARLLPRNACAMSRRS